MRKGTRILGLACFSALMTAVLVAGTAYARSGGPVSRVECVINADSVFRLDQEEEKVRITYSEAIGELLEAKFSPDAKVSVVGVYHGPTDPPLTAMVTANTTNAIAGEWELTLTGDAGACIGKAWVGRVER